MVKTKAVFLCEKCGAYYDNEKEAIECEKKPLKAPKYRVGDYLNIQNPFMTQPSIEKYEIVEIEPKVEKGTHDVIYWVFAKLMNNRVRVPEKYLIKFVRNFVIL
jgi:hypothetical protein